MSTDNNITPTPGADAGTGTDRIVRFVAHLSLVPADTPTERFAEVRKQHVEQVRNNPGFDLPAHSDWVPTIAYARDADAPLFVHRMLEIGDIVNRYDADDAWCVTHRQSGLGLPGVCDDFEEAMAYLDEIIARSGDLSWALDWQTIQQERHAYGAAIAGAKAEVLDNAVTPERSRRAD